MVAMSPLLRDILNGVYDFRLQDSHTTGAEGTVLDIPYFLGDGIYPDLPSFLNPIH